MLLVGTGQDVAGLDMAAYGCTAINGPGEVGDYAGAALLQIVSADMSRS